MRIKLFLFFGIFLFELSTFANTPWIQRIGCVPGFNKMSSAPSDIFSKKERIEIITSVSQLARNAGYKHREGAFGYFNSQNEVVDSGFCEGVYPGASGASKSNSNVKCVGSHMILIFGVNRDKCKSENGIKECIIATDAQKHQGDLTLTTENVGFSSNVMTCVDLNYGPNQPIDSIPVF
jgi:hypothetical protein